MVSRINSNMLEGTEYTNWNNAYSTVQTTSGSWGRQTISFNESNAQLTISDSNTVSLSALSSINYLYALNDVYIPSPANGQVLTYSSVLQKWTTGSPASASGQTGYYGSFYDTTAQTLTGVNQAKRLSIADTFEANGVSLSSNKIVFNNIGTYEIIFSIQYKNTSADQHDIYVWFRKNGVDIPDSSSIFTIPARKNASIPAQLIAVTPFIATLAANDFIEIYWHCNATEVTVETFTTHSNPTIPDTPGVIITVKQVTNVQLVPTVGAYLPLSGGTLTGVLSTTNIIYASGGNSNEWNSSYTTVNTNSANWVNTNDTRLVAFAADAGSTDAYAATLSPAPSAYTTGAHYRFKANTANTGAATINFNSLGAKTIVKAAGGITTTLADNDIRVGQWVDLVYDGTNMQMQSTLGNGAVAGYIVKTANYTAVAGDKIAADVTGGAFTITLPATPADGDSVEIIPARGAFYFPVYTPNLTIARNGNNINGVAVNLVLDGTNGVTLIYSSVYGWTTKNPSIRPGSPTIPGLKPDGYYGHIFFPSTTTEVAIGRYDQGATYLRIGQYGVTLNHTSSTLGWSSDPMATSPNCAVGYVGAGIINILNPSSAGLGGVLEMLQIATPSAPSTNSARIYAKDVSGTAEMFVMDEAGNEYSVGNTVGLTNTSTGTTPTELFLNGTSTRLSINTSTVVSGIATITGVKSDGSAVCMFTRKFCIKRVGSTTSIVGTVETIGSDIKDVPTPDVTLTADDTNDALAITVTGVTAETWKWKCIISGLNRHAF